MIESLKNKWPFMKVEEVKDGKFLISDEETLFVYNPNEHKSVLTEELISKRDRENMLNYELMRRYNNLTFKGMDVYVKDNGVFTGFVMSPDDEKLTLHLTRLNEECNLIKEAPEKYTFCCYCQSVIPKDYVYSKVDKGLVCKHCQEGFEWKH